ncbi:MAG: DNA internalization-related competence protein ComEC/Rec2 [Eggerthellaceae bacterium]|nr:DNA internalization-related competence protein ComEC/Rec2 [Eggerthellaceae bacterium]
MERHVEDLSLRPKRPQIPFLLAGSLLLWGVSAASFAASNHLSAGSARGIGVLLACLALMSALAAIAPRLRMASIAAAFCFMGAALGLMAAVAVADGYALADEGAKVVSVEVLQDSSASDFGYTTVCRATLAQGGSVKVRMHTKDESLLTGQRFACASALKPLKEHAKEMFRSQGISAQLSDPKLGDELTDPAMSESISIRARAIDAIRSHAGASSPLICALACGYRQDMANTVLYDRFKACGLAHLVAVSGAHMSIVLAMLLYCLSLFRAPKALAVSLSSLLVILYLTFTGFPISAVRSAIMSVLGLASFFAKRRPAALNSIGICVIAFICTDPISCMSVSLFLSAGSTLGIVLFAHLVSSWVPSVPKAVRTLVVEPASLTLSSNLVTNPVSAALFSQLSLIAPIANIVAAIPFTIACAASLASAALSLLLPDLAWLIMRACEISVIPLEASVFAMSCVPFASIPCTVDPLLALVASIVSCALLWILWPKPGKRLFCALGGMALGAALLLALPLLLPKGDSITALDVGQGDAILVRSGQSAVLVDTGNSDSMLREELARAHVASLDAVLITHPDDDHCASLPSLLSYVEVGCILVADDLTSCECGKCDELMRSIEEAAPGMDVEGLRVGDEVAVGRFKLETVWPERFEDEGGNGDSLCMLVKLDSDEDGQADHQALLTGDAESEQLASMVKSGRVGDIDLLKVGHHGSKVSLSEELAGIIRPEAALISAGAQNRYGHPSQEVLDALASADCQVLRTDEDGTITVTFTKDEMLITKEKSD